MWERNLVNYTPNEQYHSRPLVMNTGFQRLSLLAAALGAAAGLLFSLYQYVDFDGPVHWPRFIIATAIVTTVASGAAWALVRGLAWVAAGFRRPRFNRPNWN
jgi:hypothetical protein